MRTARSFPNRRVMRLIVALVLLGATSALGLADGNRQATNDDWIINVPLVLVPGARLLQPSDLTYVGAFRLPTDGPEFYNWAWGGNAMTYYPAGDATGGDDGYPGSLYGTGHDWNQWISEVSIPAPIVSAGKNVAELNTATTLQPFTSIRGDLFGELELLYCGLEYLPAQPGQSGDRLHFCWGQHHHDQQDTTHGWCDLDLSNPNVAGGWYLGERSCYSTSDYIFEIPASWAATHTAGLRLATGRFRDGGLSGQGPCLFAYGPWNHGDPPAAGARLTETPLLLYTTPDHEGTPHVLDNYHHSDDWAGGAWLTSGSRSAVVMVGTKGQGECWYGYANGLRWPDGPPYPPVPDPPYDERGWWSTTFVGRMLFYDPDDLAAVAAGRMETWEPQPYATLDLDPYLYHIASTQQLDHVGGCAYDRARALFYLFEPRADEDQPIVHVWRI